MVSKFRYIDSELHSGTFSVHAAGGRVSRPRGVALQAAGLESDNGRLGAKAAGLERATLQAGDFCAKSAVVAIQAGGLKRDTARPRDTAPCCLHRKCARMGILYFALLNSFLQEEQEYATLDSDTPTVDLATQRPKTAN